MIDGWNCLGWRFRLALALLGLLIMRCYYRLIIEQLILQRWLLMCCSCIGWLNYELAAVAFILQLALPFTSSEHVSIFNHVFRFSEHVLRENVRQ